jgi:hypothetical protein
MTPSGSSSPAAPGQQHFKLSPLSIALAITAVVVAGSLIIYFAFVQPANTSPNVPSPKLPASAAGIAGATAPTHLTSILRTEIVEKSTTKCTTTKSKNGKKKTTCPPSTPSVIEPTGSVVTVGSGVAVRLQQGWTVHASAPQSGTTAAYVDIWGTSSTTVLVEAPGTLKPGGTADELLSYFLQAFLQGSTNQSVTPDADTTINDAPGFQDIAQDQFSYTLVSSTGSQQSEGLAFGLVNTSTSNSAIVYEFAPISDVTKTLVAQWVGTLLSVLSYSAGSGSSGSSGSGSSSSGSGSSPVLPG